MKELTSKDIVLATAVASVGLVAVSAVVSSFSKRAGPVIPGRVRRLAEALFKNAGGHPGSAGAMHMPQVPPPELREVGAASLHDGERQYMTKRLYMQLRVLDVDLKSVQSMDEFVENLKLQLSSIPSV